MFFKDIIEIVVSCVIYLSNAFYDSAIYLNCFIYVLLSD